MFGILSGIKSNKQKILACKGDINFFVKKFLSHSVEKRRSGTFSVCKICFYLAKHFMKPKVAADHEKCGSF